MHLRSNVTHSNLSLTIPFCTLWNVTSQRGTIGCLSSLLFLFFYLISHSLTHLSHNLNRTWRYQAGTPTFGIINAAIPLTPPNNNRMLSQTGHGLFPSPFPALLLTSSINPTHPGIDYTIDGRIILPRTSNRAEIQVSPVHPSQLMKLELSLGDTPDSRTLRFFINDSLQHIISRIPPRVKFAVFSLLFFFSFIRFFPISSSLYLLSIYLSFSLLFCIPTLYAHFSVHFQFRRSFRRQRRCWVHLFRNWHRIFLFSPIQGSFSSICRERNYIY